MTARSCDEANAEMRSDLDAAYREHRPSLLRFLRRVAGPVEADDLLQQGFVRLVLLGPERVAAIGTKGLFLRTVTLNIARDRARADARRPVVPTDDDHTAAAPDPVAALEARDMLQRIERIVATMPQRRREIFLAHRIDGYSYSEIAARTGLSVKGIEKQMSRAIAHIDRVLGRR